MQKENNHISSLKHEFRRIIESEQGSREFHRHSDGNALPEKPVRLDKLDRLDRDRENDREREKGSRKMLGCLRNQENCNFASTIDMLKRRVELLDLEDDEGRVPKLSTLDHFDVFPSRQILLQVTKFKKQNARKIAKGRPQLYNWVRKNRKQMAQINPNTNHNHNTNPNNPNNYKTNISKKSSKQLQKHKKQPMPTKSQQKQSCQKYENSMSCKKLRRRLTFVERLRMIEESKEKVTLNRILHEKRFHSENEETANQYINFVTLV